MKQSNLAHRAYTSNELRRERVEHHFVIIESPVAMAALIPCLDQVSFVDGWIWDDKKIRDTRVFLANLYGVQMACVLTFDEYLVFKAKGKLSTSSYYIPREIPVL